MPSSLELLADRLFQAADVLEQGQLTLAQATELTKRFLRITMPKEGMFPDDHNVCLMVDGLLGLMQELHRALGRYRRIGVLDSTKLSDIPLLTRGISTAKQLVLDGKMVAVSFW